MVQERNYIHILSDYMVIFPKNDTLGKTTRKIKKFEIISILLFTVRVTVSPILQLELLIKSCTLWIKKSKILGSCVSNTAKINQILQNTYP